jgi:hypothetical protein
MLSGRFHLLGDLLGEVGCLLGMSQAGAGDVKSLRCFTCRNDYVNPCLFGQANRIRELDPTVLDNPFVRGDLHDLAPATDGKTNPRQDRDLHHESRE